MRHRGHIVKINDFATYALIHEHDFKIRVREKVRMETVKDGSWDRRIFHPTGILCFQVKDYPEKEWKDGKLSLDQQLAAILAWLEIQGEQKKADRIEQAKKAKQREEEKIIQLAFEKRRNEELSAFKLLLQKAERWQKSDNLRNYIAHLSSQGSHHQNPCGGRAEWLKWAASKADWYDPLIEKKDELLESIDRDTLSLPRSMYSYF